MSATNPNGRLLRFLQATPEMQAAIDRILDGKSEPAPVPIANALTSPPAAVATVREEYLTKKEVAKRLRKTVRTVEKWQRAGYLPYVKPGRSVLFKWADVEAHLQQNFRVCRHATSAYRRSVVFGEVRS